MAVEKKAEEFRWHPDAAANDLSPASINRYLVKTSRISEFLDSKRSVVIGPKGTGKTLLLRYLSATRSDRLNGHSSIRIPSNRELDTFHGSIGIRAITLQNIDTHDAWEELWITAIMSSAICAFAVESEAGRGFVDRLLEELKEDGCKLTQLLKRIKRLAGYFLDDGGIVPVQSDLLSSLNPSSILSTLLQSTPSELHKSLKRTSQRLTEKALSINTPFDIYIDQTDQGIEAYPLEIWKHAQTGLVGAIFRLRHQGHIKVFTTIRQEAWTGFAHEQLTQMRGIVTEIDYSDDELREVFSNSVNVIEHTKSAKCDGAIFEFLGADEIDNNWIEESEDVFDYILRHTLRRPRDQALLGQVFHVQNQTKEGLTKEKIKSIVNEVPATEVGDQYWIESQRFLTSFENVDRQRLYSLFSQNVLSERGLIEICSAYNSDIICIAKKGGSCRDCHDAAHIFCDLYRVGLLGTIVRGSTTLENKVQKFRRAGDTRILHVPNSSHYVLHPTMDYIISNIYDNDSYQPIKGIRVGQGLIWQPKYSSLVDACGIERLLDSAVVDDDLRREIIAMVDVLRLKTEIDVDARDSYKTRLRNLLDAISNSQKITGDFARRMNDVIELVQRGIETIPGIGGTSL